MEDGDKRELNAWQSICGNKTDIIDRLKLEWAFKNFLE